MGQAMQQSGLAEEMARLQQGLRVRAAGSALGRPAAHGRRRARWASPTRRVRSPNWPTSTSSTTCSARTTRARAWTTSTRNSSSARSASAAVDDVAQLRRIERELRDQGYLQRGSEGLRLTPARAAPARVDRAQAGVRRARVARPRRPRRPRCRCGRRGHRRQPRVALRRRTAAGRRAHRPQRRAAQHGRRGRAQPGARGLRDRRDRAALVGGGRVARRHVLLDGTARHVGRGEDDRPRTARADQHASSRRTRSRSSASATTPG